MMMAVLEVLGNSYSAATAINDLGQVVGISMTASFAHHAFLWQNGTMADLGTLGGTFSLANDINDRGQVVGESNTSSGVLPRLPLAERHDDGSRDPPRRDSELGLRRQRLGADRRGQPQ